MTPDRCPPPAVTTPDDADADIACRLAPAAACSRRACLGAFLAASLAGCAGAGTAAARPERLWLALFAGTTGGPVYWLTRGIEFIVVDGVATPVRGRISAIAAMARPRDDGTVRVAYLLQGCTVTPTGFEFVPRLVHPVTGEELSTAVTAPLRLGWNLAANGDLTEDLVAANGTRAVYRGTTWESPGTGEERGATLNMSIRLERPNGEVETFTEVSRTRTRPAGTGAPDAFLAAESETFTTRDLPDPARYKGRTAMSMSMNHGVNHPGVDELRRVMRPRESSALAGFFEQLPAWVTGMSMAKAR